MSKLNKRIENLKKQSVLSEQNGEFAIYAQTYPVTQLPTAQNLENYILVVNEKSLKFYKYNEFEANQQTLENTIDWLDLNSSHNISSFGLWHKFLITYNSGENFKLKFKKYLFGYGKQMKAARVLAQRLTQISTKELI